MSKNRKYRHGNSFEGNILIQKLDEAINKNEALRIKNDMLQVEVDNEKSNNGALRAALSASSKQTDQAVMTARYLTHIFLMMDMLEKILENNYSIGWVIKNAFNNFKREIANSMLDFHYDGENVWFDPTDKDKDVIFGDEDEDNA
jgi:predicted RNase H-like nuclease (RuvC/YqgF family)